MTEIWWLICLSVYVSVSVSGLCMALCVSVCRYVSVCVSMSLSVSVSVYLQAFVDDGQGHVAGVKTVLVNWSKDADGKWKFCELPGQLVTFVLCAEKTVPFLRVDNF